MDTQTSRESELYSTLFIDKYKPNQLEKAKENARNLSISEKKSMAVVKKDHDHYQVWSAAKASDNVVYIAEYSDNVSVIDSVNDGGGDNVEN